MAKKGGGSQTVTTKPDPATAQYTDLYRRIAATLAQAGLGGWGSPALANFAGGGGAGAGAPGGSPTGPGLPAGWGIPGAGGGAAAAFGRSAGMPWANASASPGQLNEVPVGAPGVLNDGTGQPFGLRSAYDPSNPFTSLAMGGLLNLGKGDVSQFFNPYESQVIGGVQSDYDRQRAQAMNAANEQATKFGAFGGSRSGVLAAQGQEAVNRDEAQKLAALRYQGYGDAFSRAQQVLPGLLDIGKDMNLEDWNRAIQALGLLGTGLGGGGTSTTQPLGGGGNAFGTAAGGAATGFGIGGPVGAGIGGGLGLLSGIFGW